MEGFRKPVTKRQPFSGSSRSDSSFGIPDRARSGRSRVHSRGPWSGVEGRGPHKAQTCELYENTFRLETGDNTQFSVLRVQQIIRDVFEHYLHELDYDPRVFPLLIQTLTEAIKDGVKTQHLHRYRVITTVTAMQKKGQGTQFSSRALWNPSSDKCASLTYESPGYVVVGVVYAVYQE